MNKIDYLQHLRTITLKDNEYKLFTDLIYKKTGIDLGANKKELVKGRLMKRIRLYQLKSFKEYYEYVSSDASGDEIVEMINAISTNVTHFFREKDHFDILHQRILPEILRKKINSHDKQIRIWSAACSTGEEVYSILSTVLESIPDLNSWDLKILGTDISTKVLRIAQQGIYSEEKLKTVPKLMRTKYFNKLKKLNQTFYQIKEELAGIVVFRRLNLMQETFPFKKKFDIIFCRNVMIYFDKQTQKALVTKFIRYLSNDGFLFVGHAESLLDFKLDLKTIAPATFQKI